MAITMFSSSHLGKWEEVYKNLTEGERTPFNESETWLLGKKPGIISIFESDEIVYVTSTSDIVKEIQQLLKSNNIHEFRQMVAIVDLGISITSVSKGLKNKKTTQRIDKKIQEFKYRIVPVRENFRVRISDAFIAVADPRYNGLTTRSNLAIDNLPK